MFHLLFPQDFWEGLSRRKRIRGQSLFSFGLISPFISIPAVLDEQYLIATGMILISSLVLLIFLYTFRERLSAWWNDKGWRCCVCRERIGFGNAEEAFLLKGKIGNIPKQFIAWIECSQKHLTEISWRQAVQVMVSSLSEHIQEAQNQMIWNEKKEDTSSQKKYRMAKAFYDKANKFNNNNDLGKYIYNHPADLYRQLTKYSNRRWMPQDKETLYDLLVTMEAYCEIRNSYEQQGLNFEIETDPTLKNQDLLPIQIFPEQIENFKRIATIPLEAVDRLLTTDGYFDRAEEFIKVSLEKILNEKLHKKDWGGEENDLYTSNIIVNNKRRAAAFILKGRGAGVKLLKPKHIGKNGDQIIRAFGSPAEIFFLQFVGNVDENVIKQLELGVLGIRHQGKPASYCVINGQDTARLLLAYGKI